MPLLKFKSKAVTSVVNEIVRRYHALQEKTVTLFPFFAFFADTCSTACSLILTFFKTFVCYIIM